MTLLRISGPVTLPVSVAAAKANGRIDADAEDSFVEDLIRAALAHAETWCGQSFEPQAWEMVLDAFPPHEICLGIGPVTSVTSVKFTAAEGEATVSPAAYEVDTVSRQGRVVPTGPWPTALATINAVRVRFVLGPGAPEAVQQAVLLLAEHWNENRAGEPIPRGVYELLNLHRRIFV